MIPLIAMKFPAANRTAARHQQSIRTPKHLEKPVCVHDIHEADSGDHKEQNDVTHFGKFLPKGSKHLICKHGHQHNTGDKEDDDHYDAVGCVDTR